MTVLIVFGVLFLTALLPVGVTLRYGAQGFSASLVIGFLRVHLPLRGKKKKGDKLQRTDAPKRGKASAAHGEERGGSPAKFLPLGRIALRFLNGLRKKLRVDRLTVRLTLAGDDPCDLALNYGKANAALGNLLPLLERSLVIRKRDLRVECDFTAEETRLLADAKLTILLGRLLALFLRYGAAMIKEYRKIQKGGDHHE